MENFFEVFPQYGKLFEEFSTAWKIFSDFFHAMENCFSHCEKRDENACFQRVYGCWIGAVERSTRRPL